MSAQFGIAAPRGATTSAEGDQTLLTDDQLDRIAVRLERMAGIIVDREKRQMIHTRISKRLRATGIPDVESYLTDLDKKGDPEELQLFLNALTTNLTSMFREGHHFEHFSGEVVTAARNARKTRLRIWSAGCSTGEEPYSIALSILRICNPIPADYKILATDLDTAVLAQAETGVLPPQKVKGIPPDLAALVRKDPDTGGAKIPAAAMGAITFKQLNLNSDWPMKGPFDAIFCRNVMIYFSSETKAALVDRFARILQPGGFLYLGHSETVLGDHPLLEPIGTTSYRRRSA